MGMASWFAIFKCVMEHSLSKFLLIKKAKTWRKIVFELDTNKWTDDFIVLLTMVIGKGKKKISEDW